MRQAHGNCRARGLCPCDPGIYRFFSARMAILVTGTGMSTCPPPFRPLNRSLGLLPSIALSRPVQVGSVSTTSFAGQMKIHRTAFSPLNFVSHVWGSPQVSFPCIPFFPSVLPTIMPALARMPLLRMPFDGSLSLPSRIPCARPEESCLHPSRFRLAVCSPAIRDDGVST